MTTPDAVTADRWTLTSITRTEAGTYTVVLRDPAGATRAYQFTTETVTLGDSSILVVSSAGFAQDTIFHPAGSQRINDAVSAFHRVSAAPIALDEGIGD